MELLIDEVKLKAGSIDPSINISHSVELPTPSTFPLTILQDSTRGARVGLAEVLAPEVVMLSRAPSQSTLPSKFYPKRFVVHFTSSVKLLGKKKKRLVCLYASYRIVKQVLRVYYCINNRWN